MATRIDVTGMGCTGCAQAVEDALTSISGVTAVDVDLEDDRVTVDGDADPADLVAAIETSGYEATTVTG